jgi:hypothetical protein
MIGIKECPAPHNSEHCPVKIPFRFINKNAWFNRPGIASALIPIDGIAHE